MTNGFILAYEPRPSDFTARLGRRAPAIAVRGRARHHRHRALALLAAVAVPAFAAPGQWPAFAIGDAGRAEARLEPMPFEKPGDSFPGSAFYYLAATDQPQPAAPQPFSPLAPDVHSDAEPMRPEAVARALKVDNSGVDRGRALQCLTAAVYYEAASEPDSGQRAVAQVVLNRVAHRAYPNTVCGVVYQGSERRTGCQFSFTCDGSLARHPNRLFWQRAEDVARAALAGYVHAPVGLATHYHTTAVHPYWAPKLAFLGTIGAHRFYRFGGAAGQLGAFRFAYAGGEPVAAPHPRSATPAIGPDPRLDPLVLERAYETGLARAQGGIGSQATIGLAPARPAPAPVYAAELQQRGGEALYRGRNLPQGQGIRPEYQNSGAWIAQPGA